MAFNKVSRTINLTSQNLNELYTISFPKNLITFLKYDFTIFMERCLDLCRMYMKTGEYKEEEVLEVKSSILGCHKYVEQGSRSIFDKIVIDCWIEFICRQNEVSAAALWNNYIACRNDFERVVFTRLSEYRHNQAINQWVNILKVQEYANRKVMFVFGEKLKSPNEGAARANYFDLMFNVTANELGFEIENIAENRLYSVGRTPNSPFVMSNISREIVRNILSDMKYYDQNVYTKKNTSNSDQKAMDAFTAIKSFIPTEPDSIASTLIKSIADAPQKVYIPESFKAVIDLEIDALLESDGVIQKCARCGEYYLKDEDYNYDYCDRINREGKTCLSLMNIKVEKEKRNTGKKKIADTSLLNMRCDQLYKEMSSRINVDITQRDFSDWYKYMMLIRENVMNGEATMEDFESFEEYSLSINFGKSTSQTIQTTTPETKEADYKKPKPFVFERIDRNQLEQQDNLLYEPPRESTKKKSRTDDFTDFDRTSVDALAKPVKLNNPQTVIESESDLNAFDAEFSLTDEDVKIYDYEPVKVFSPKDDKKRRKKTTQAPVNPLLDPKIASDNVAEISYEQPKKIRKTSESSNVEADVLPRLNLSFARTENTQVSPSRANKAVSVYRQAAGGNETSVGDNILNRLNDEDDVIEVRLSQNTEKSVEMGFSEMLRNADRSDGFTEENIPTDADGVPVSHKTKRVMDAIFKQPKQSMFLNVNKPDDE